MKLTLTSYTYMHIYTSIYTYIKKPKTKSLFDEFLNCFKTYSCLRMLKSTMPTIYTYLYIYIYIYIYIYVYTYIQMKQIIFNL